MRLLSGRFCQRPRRAFCAFATNLRAGCHFRPNANIFVFQPFLTTSPRHISCALASTFMLVAFPAWRRRFCFLVASGNVYSVPLALSPHPSMPTAFSAWRRRLCLLDDFASAPQRAFLRICHKLRANCRFSPSVNLSVFQPFPTTPKAYFQHFRRKPSCRLPFSPERECLCLPAASVSAHGVLFALSPQTFVPVAIFA